MRYRRHPHIKDRRIRGPIKGAETLPRHTAITRCNTWLALKLTRGVGTMWCAYAFGLLALVALPSAIHAGSLALVQWVSQTFIQLVMLSVILVGQNILGKASDDRADQTFKDAEAILHESLQIQDHLKEQDVRLQDHAARLNELIRLTHGGLRHPAIEETP